MENSDEVIPFEVDVKRLVNHITIGSFFNDPDVFLHHLLSNACDALSILKFICKADPDRLGLETDFVIRIIPDKLNKILSVEDTGIGMKREDLVNYLGTIARSGSREFMESNATSIDTCLLGSAGVGFYSVYSVADKVLVSTKHDFDIQLSWEGFVNGFFHVKKDMSHDILLRGTKVSLHLRECHHLGYLEDNKIIELFRKNENRYSFPVYLWTKKGGSMHYDWMHLNLKEKE